MKDTRELFIEAIIAAGIKPPKDVISDGIIHRYSTNNKPNDEAGWYVLYDYGVFSAGAYGCWRVGVSHTWHTNMDRSFTPQEEKVYQEKIEQIRLKADAENERRHAQAREEANRIIKASSKAPEDFPYLVKKQVYIKGVLFYNERLVVPMFDEYGSPQGLQFIDKNATKRTLKGSRLKGSYFPIGKPENILCFSESISTGSTINKATGYAVAVVFGTHNLLPVAQILRKKFPETQFVFCADDDYHLPDNPGLNKAKEAALAVNGLLAIPDFGNDRPEGMTDFNDLALCQSLESVKKCIQKAFIPNELSSEKLPNLKRDNEDWPELFPIFGSVDELYPYPIDALPDGIKNAVIELIGFYKCPVALAVCSALSALSLVGQGLVDVSRRNRTLISPTCLFFLVTAYSGERKTACDKCFTAPIEEWQKSELERLKPEIDRHKALLTSWKVKISGLKQRICKAMKNSGQNAIKDEEALIALQAAKPKPPKIPKLLYADTTPEALAFDLSQKWPYGGVISSEAGIFFGSHAMRNESIMSSLSLYNITWEGGTIQVDRRQSESFVLRNARLTMGLAVQQKILRAFYNSSKGLARDIGFISRFLFADPPSTQGTRFIDGPDLPFIHLPGFQKRIEELLRIQPTFDNAGGLINYVLHPSEEADEIWKAYYNSVEREIGPNRDFVENRDSASKTPENAARIAALFHLFENGVRGEISSTHMVNAAKVATYHLYEKKRFDNEIALPEEILNALTLDRWLIKQCRELKVNTVPANEILHKGPATLRLKTARNAAIEILLERGRIKSHKKGKGLFIEVNPKLLEGKYETE